MGVIRVYSAEEAKGSVLRRAPWEEQAMPAGLMQAIERIWAARRPMRLSGHPGGRA
jgi:hypothetical protein